MNEAPSRRTVLRVGTTLGSVGILGSLAGCTDLLGDDSDGVDYTDWLYEPGTVRDGVHYSFTFRDDQAVRGLENGINSAIYERLTPHEDADERERFEEMGITYDDIRSRLATDATVVFFGEFDGQTVVEELESNGYTADGDHRDFAVVHRQETREEFDGPREYDLVFGIDDGTAVFSQAASEAELDPRTAVEAVIDAGAGEGTRYVDANEDMARLTEELGTGTIVSGKTRTPPENLDEIEGLVASGRRATVETDATESRAVFLFDSEANADASDVDYALRQYHGEFDLKVDHSASRSGRSVVASGEDDTTEAFTPVVVPNPTFGFDYTSLDQEVTVLVNGGDAFDAGQVSVQGYKIADSHAVSLDSDVYFGEDTSVSAGERFTVELDPGGESDTDDFELQLVWEAEDGDISGTIDETAGPDASL